jgi:hypothetical protein
MRLGQLAKLVLCCQCLAIVIESGPVGQCCIVLSVFNNCNRKWASWPMFIVLPVSRDFNRNLVSWPILHYRSLDLFGAYY